MDREDAMEEHSDDAASSVSPSGAKESQRKRSSRACDQCRKAKSRCDPSPDDGPCKSCSFSGTTCTFQGPSQKRGPPKGYLNALETRLHEAEALLGAIISSPQAEPLVAVLSRDPLAEQIITRVNKSVFGALGRPPTDQPEGSGSRGRRRPDKERQRMTNSEVAYSRDSGSPVFTSPSYAWQDHLNEQLATTESPSGSTLCDQSAAISRSESAAASHWDRSRRQRRRTELGESLRVDLHSADQESLYSASMTDFRPEPGNLDGSGSGQLYLDQYQQIRYLGEASGLTLLGQCPRTDTLYHQQIWRMPQTRLYSPSLDRRPLTFDEIEQGVRLPDRSVQEHLLRQYFHYVHPILPIVNRDEFWDEWTSMHKFDSGGPAKFLLLAMFALAARYSDPETLDQSNRSLSGAGNDYMEEAKSLLSQTFTSSRMSTCQALLLLGYREIGLGGMTDSSLFLMMAIQMAQDLGLNRHADQWTRDGSCIFSDRLLRLRRSVWYGCVVLDIYIAAQLGRPLRIRHEDYDTRLPDVDTQEDFQIWMPYRNAPAAQGYNPLPGRITSCFRALCSLGQIFSMVLHKIYAVNTASTTVHRHTEAFELDQRLQRWYMELPESLRFTTSPVPPPQILCLHMFYWCLVLLLQRSFIQIQSPNSQFSSRRALDLGAAAATNLSNIVHTYHTAFGLRHSPALLTYYLTTAGVMHVAILQTRPQDSQAKLGLNRCLTGLDEMKNIWPAASYIYELLSGANVDKRERSPMTQSDQSRKRRLDESSSAGSSHTSHTNTRSTRSNSVPPQPPGPAINVFHPSASFMELTHSLGLDPSGLDRVFGAPGPGYTSWPSNDLPFSGMHGDVIPHAAMMLGGKGPS